MKGLPVSQDQGHKVSQTRQRGKTESREGD